MGTVRDPACRSYESSSDALAVPPSSTGVAAGSTLPQIEVVGVQETAHHSAARERSASIGTQGLRAGGERMVDYRTLCVGCEAMASRRLESRGRALSGTLSHDRRSHDSDCGDYMIRT